MLLLFRSIVKKSKACKDTLPLVGLKNNLSLHHSSIHLKAFQDCTVDSYYATTIQYIQPIQVQEMKYGRPYSSLSRVLLDGSKVT